MGAALKVAVLTVSDTRTQETDTSGAFLEEALREAGHEIADRQIVIDDVYQLRAIVSQWIADPEVEVILTTGGTGFSGRDSTPEALAPLFDKTIDGFGEVFRCAQPHRNRLLNGAISRTRGSGERHRDFLHARVHRRLSHCLGGRVAGSARQRTQALQFCRGTAGPLNHGADPSV